MTPDPIEYWQDVDGSDEKEVQFITALSMWNLEHALRPRDEFDVDVHPASYRGYVLAYYDALDAAVATLRSTRRGRLILWLSRRRLLSVLLSKWRRRPDSNR